MVEVKDLNERKTGQEPVREQEEAGWFHICSQGLEGVDLFPDEKAFITGVNKFAAAFKLFGEDIEVAILVLVSTHFHSLAWGAENRCGQVCGKIQENNQYVLFPPLRHFESDEQGAGQGREGGL